MIIDSSQGGDEPKFRHTERIIIFVLLTISFVLCSTRQHLALLALLPAHPEPILDLKLPQSWL